MSFDDPKHYCLKEQDWGRLWEIVKRNSAHVIAGDCDGGFRDRLLIAERDISELRKRFWFASIIGGLIGALIGSGSQDVLAVLFRWIMRIGP